MPSGLLEAEQLLASCNSLHRLQSILGRLIVTGLFVNHPPFTLCKVVQFLAFNPNSSFLPYARLLVHSSSPSSSSTFLYNTIIRAYSCTPSPRHSLIAFSTMLRNSVKPDNFTFPFLLKASTCRNSLLEGKQIHDHTLKAGLLPDVFVLNNLLNMYSTFAHMESAFQLFNENRPWLDVVSWNTIIQGCIECGALDIARQCFDEMPHRNEVTWSAMIAGYARTGELDVAQSLFDKMPVQRNTITWNSMISGFARSGLLSLARQFFDEMPRKNLRSWNSMIAGYAQSGEFEQARQLFNEMPERDVFSWSCMISGCAQNNRCRDALQLFKEMQIENRAQPNEVTLLSMLSVSAQLAALDLGKWIHAYIHKNRMKLSDNLGAALIDMYAKCGSLETATEVFWKMDERNISAWNAMITGWAINGIAYKSLQVFTEMQRSGIKPNDITFVGVLMACSHGGLVNEGRQQFESMSKSYGIQPELKHYGCMVDLFGRAGLLKEAEEIVRSMPMKPDVTILGSLLGACKIHGDVGVADRVCKEFLELGNLQAGCHVLLSNIYAAAGRWADASELRSIIKRKGIKKDPGCSLFELDGAVYEFIAGDHSYPQIGEIRLWLDDIGRKLKSQGYSPVTTDVLLDVDEEDKETWLSYHSEKLALAFAMINTAPGSTIRIVKNLRICGDCHSFTKHVSNLCLRRILIRDKTRYHHFDRGTCSCRDYW